MIKVVDVAGKEKYINCDLIEKIELIPDTLITLINGHNFIVRNGADEIVEMVTEFKRSCNEISRKAPINAGPPLNDELNVD